MVSVVGVVAAVIVIVAVVVVVAIGFTLQQSVHVIANENTTDDVTRI